jgi:aspartate/methionine/tyrosine aminotransferase
MTTAIVADRRREAEARQTLLRAALGLSRNAGSPHALHHWLELPRQWERAPDFVETLRRRGVLVTPGDAFAVDATQPVRAVRVQPWRSGESSSALECPRDHRVRASRRSRARTAGKVDVAAGLQRAQ